MFIASAIPTGTTALIKSRLGCSYREAVTKPSPGLPRFAATLGVGSNETNPKRGCVSFSAQEVMEIWSNVAARP